MKDILHRVESTESGFRCGDCEIDLPPDVCLTEIVAEIAGLNQFVPVMPGEDSGLSCTSKAADKARETGELVAEAEAEIPEEKPMRKKSFKLSDMEKQARGAQFNAFLMEREATRPGPDVLSEDIS